MLQPAVRELDDPGPVRIEPGAEVRASARRHRGHVPRRQEVNAGVVREEELRGVEAGRGGKAAPARGGGVVGQPSRVARVMREQLRPPGIAGDGSDEQHLLQRIERFRRLARGEGQRPVRDRGPLGEAARAATVDRLDQREGRGLDQAVGTGGMASSMILPFAVRASARARPRPPRTAPAPRGRRRAACVVWFRTLLSPLGRRSAGRESGVRARRRSAPPPVGPQQSDVAQLAVREGVGRASRGRARRRRARRGARRGRGDHRVSPVRVGRHDR